MNHCRGAFGRAVASVAFACVLMRTAPARAESMPIDLPTTLKLVGAQNSEVLLARSRLAEARAAVTSADWHFFPWLGVGVLYRGHSGRTQDVIGNIVDVNKHMYAPGISAAAEVALGDAWYGALAARRTARAFEHEVEGERQKAVLTAVEGYLDLVAARAEVKVAEDAQQLARAYETELGEAVAAGIAYKAEQLRVRVLAERVTADVRKAQAHRRTASARLAAILHVNPTIDLTPREDDLVPLSVYEADPGLPALVEQALDANPSLQQGRAAIDAASAREDQARYGPLIPTLGGQAYLGWLGGGRPGVADSIGGSVDYAAYLQWRIGPGGLFDKGRIDAAAARRNGAELDAIRIRDEVVRRVVESHERMSASADEMRSAKNGLGAAEEALSLARARRDFAVAGVLENILAEQDLTRARTDYLRAVAENAKAQYALKWATGTLEMEGRAR